MVAISAVDAEDAVVAGQIVVALEVDAEATGAMAANFLNRSMPRTGRMTIHLSIPPRRTLQFQ